MLETPTSQDKVKHINQMSILAFLKDAKGFNPISDGYCVITDIPVKAQTYAGHDTHACVFKDGSDFSDWINKHTGAVTRAVGDTVFWDEIPEESRKKMLKYGFFHTEEQLHCSIFSKKFFEKAV